MMALEVQGRAIEAGGYLEPVVDETQYEGVEVVTCRRER